MATVTRFEDLHVWQTARELTRSVYQVTSQGAFSRDYGLRDQIRRSSVSVMDNVAEGFESRTQVMFVDYLGRAKGSCGELRSQLYVVLDAGYLSEAEFGVLRAKAEHCSRQTRKLMRYLEETPTSLRLREDHAEYDVDQQPSTFNFPTSNFEDAERS